MGSSRPLAVLCALAVAAPAAAGSGGRPLGIDAADSLVEPRGAFVLTVLPGGPAARGGLLAGDVIVGCDGAPVGGLADLERLLAARRGDAVRVRFVHADGRRAEATLRIGPPARDGASGARPPPAPPPRAAPESRAPPVAWTPFVDPVEHAFSLAVPAGWSVRGGARRVTQVEVRLEVRAISPDGATELFYGDASIPPFIAPNRMLAMAGLRPGSVYSPGYGEQLLVEPYATGEAFAATWGARRVAERCGEVRRTGARDLPGASRGLDRAAASAGVRTSLRAGEATFACARGGAPAAGYVFAATQAAAQVGAELWQVKTLTGFVAPAAEAGRAAALLGHLAASFRVDPAWLRAQAGADAAMSEVVARQGAILAQAISDRYAAEQAASGSIHAAYENSVRAHDRAHAGEVETIRGVHSYADPEDRSRTFQADSVHEYQWIGPGHSTPVGTDSDTPPFEGARRLERLPPGGG